MQTNKILNPDVVCKDCGNRYTVNGEWIGDNYMCDVVQQYCLNCCGCEDHDPETGGSWYSPAHETMSVQGLINFLQQIPDKQQPIIWQFYLAKHFPIPPKDKEQIFAEVAEEVNSHHEMWAGVYWQIDSIVEDKVNGYHTARKQNRNPRKEHSTRD